MKNLKLIILAGLSFIFSLLILWPEFVASKENILAKIISFLGFTFILAGVSYFFLKIFIFIAKFFMKLFIDLNIKKLLLKDIDQIILVPIGLFFLFISSQNQILIILGFALILIGLPSFELKEKDKKQSYGKFNVWLFIFLYIIFILINFILFSLSSTGWSAIAEFMQIMFLAIISLGYIISMVIKSVGKEIFIANKFKLYFFAGMIVLLQMFLVFSNPGDCGDAPGNCAGVLPRIFNIGDIEGIWGFVFMIYLIGVFKFLNSAHECVKRSIFK